MRSNGLLSFLVLSDIRKGIVCSLLERPATLDELKQHLNPVSPLSSAHITPYIKELLNRNIIYRDDNIYYLTPIGKTLVKKLKSMIDVFDVIDNNGKFFSDHDLEPIPDYLLERIDELGDCRIIKNSLDNITATYRVVMDQLLNSKSIRGISPIFDMEYPDFFSSMAEHKIPMMLILTDKIYNKIKKEHHVAFIKK